MMSSGSVGGRDDLGCARSRRDQALPPVGPSDQVPDADLALDDLKDLALTGWRADFGGVDDDDVTLASHARGGGPLTALRCRGLLRGDPFRGCLLRGCLADHVLLLRHVR